jgi:hypothetical protein
MTMKTGLTAAMRIATSITLLNVLVASGFSVAGLIRPDLILPAGAVPNDASAIFAMYAAARTLTLAASVIAAVVIGSRSALLVLGSLAGLIQGADAVVGLVQGDLGKSVGPLVLALLQAYAMLRLRSAEA